MSPIFVFEVVCFKNASKHEYEWQQRKKSIRQEEDTQSVERSPFYLLTDFIFLQIEQSG